MAFALHGPTLTLRPPEPGDAAALLELASDPEVTRWLSWGPYTAIDQPLAYIERCAAQREAGAAFGVPDVFLSQIALGAAHGFKFASWFGRTLAGLRKAVALGKRSYRGLPLHMVYFAEALVLLEELQRRGHRIVTIDDYNQFGSAQLIWKLDGGYFAASDPRRDGQAVGV